MNNNLNRIPFLLHLSKRTVSVIRQNLAFVLIYVLVMIVILAWLGTTHVTSGLPILAAVSHGFSSIIVVFNSARLVREGEQLEDHEAVPDNHRRIRTETVAPAPAV